MNICIAVSPNAVFERRFQLADTIKIVGADYKDGLLNIELDRVVPEQKKPRKIEIGGAKDEQPKIEGDVVDAKLKQQAA